MYATIFSWPKHWLRAEDSWRNIKNGDFISGLFAYFYYHSLKVRGCCMKIRQRWHRSIFAACASTNYFNFLLHLHSVYGGGASDLLFRSSPVLTIIIILVVYGDRIRSELVSGKSSATLTMASARTCISDHDRPPQIIEEIDRDNPYLYAWYEFGILRKT